MRIGLGWLEVYKKRSQSTLHFGPKSSWSEVRRVDALLSQSKNTGFTRVLDLIATVKYSELPAYLALGTGSAPKSPDNPFLSNEFVRVPRSESKVVSAKQKAEYMPTAARSHISTWWVREHSYSYTPSYNVTASEWGISESGVPNSPLIAGGLMPAPITLEAGETYVFKYKTTVYYAAQNPTSTTIPAEENESTVTSMPEFIEHLLIGHPTVNYNGATYTLKAISDLTSTLTPMSYINGSYLRKYTFTAKRSLPEYYFSIIYEAESEGAMPPKVYVFGSHSTANIPTSPETRTLVVSWTPWSDF